MMSMTGFGRGSSATQHWLATVEISSVNRKQAEVSINLPREISELESAIRQTVLGTQTRGRLQVTVRLEATGNTTTEVRLDPTLALALEKSFEKLSTLVHREIRPQSSDFLQLPGVLSTTARAIACDEAWEAIEPALIHALHALHAMRRREGADLQNDLLTHLAEVKRITAEIASHVPGRSLRQREMLEKRLRDAGIQADFNDERFTRELALHADRSDISEELARLDSHLGKFHHHLESDNTPGRALDFLCQELMRECNTIGAKAGDAAISHCVVDAKTAVEKIREQVQNVE